MRVVASASAVETIKAQGGRLYVWPRRGRCCGSVTTLATAAAPPAGRRFERVAAEDGFELYFPVGLTRAPDELHLESKSFPRRVEAYWNGCVWVV
jgi:hypothetical protein